MEQLMATLVYKYGMHRPNVNADLVDEQMRLAHRYYNRLIEIRRKKRDRFREILKTSDDRHEILKPLIEQAETLREELRDARQALKDLRARSRKRVDTASQREQVRELSERSKAAAATLKEARASCRRTDAQCKLEQKEATDAMHEEIRASRSICGVFWGTYLQIERSAEQADKTTHLWAKGQPSDPHFRRWKQEGLIAVQLQKPGLLASEVMTDHSTFLQIDMPNRNPTSKRQAKLRRGTLKMRIGSEGRAPIWAEWPLQMHRPLPPGAVITWATILKRRTADRDRWTLHLTVEVPQPKPSHGIGVVAVDIGWRMLHYGVRVAYIIDDEGTEREILLDPEVLSGLRKAEDLRSIRDKAQNQMTEKMLSWFKVRSAELHPDLKERIQHAHLWKSPARWVALALKWASVRVEGDGEGYECLESWRKQDQHLWRWEAHQRRRSLNRRQDAYLCLAKELSQRYHTIVLESKFLAQTQKHEVPESEKIEIPEARLKQRDASCYEMKQSMIRAFQKAGGKHVEIDPYLTTQRCFLCGHEGRWNAAAQVEHTCDVCGETWDQDANACRNLLKQYREQSGEESPAPKKKQAKWERLGRHTKTARKEDGNHPELQTT